VSHSVDCFTEEDVFQAMGLVWVPPAARGCGEVTLKASLSLTSQTSEPSAPDPAIFAPFDEGAVND